MNSSKHTVTESRLFTVPASVSGKSGQCTSYTKAVVPVRLVCVCMCVCVCSVTDGSLSLLGKIERERKLLQYKRTVGGHNLC